PVVFEPGSEPRWLEGPVGPPLGVTGAAQRPNIVVDLRPGTMLSLFTDGLVERRGEPLDQGVKRLAASLEVDSAQRSCSAAIATLVGVQDRPDDVAVLVMRREGADHGALGIKVAAARSSVGPVRSSLRRWLNHRQIGDDDSQRILLAA